MKFNKEQVGVFITGATLYSSTEQNFKILDFAVAQGFELDHNELEHAKLDYANNIEELSPEWYEVLDYVLEDALEYLNINCVERGVAFTFIDTDFALIGVNGLDKNDTDEVN